MLVPVTTNPFENLTALLTLEAAGGLALSLPFSLAMLEPH